MAHRKSKSRKELKALNAQELKVKAKEAEDHIFQLRMQFKTGQLASTAMLGLARSELARIRTLVSQKAKVAGKSARA